MLLSITSIALVSGDELFRGSININDLERPRNNRCFSDFFCNFGLRHTFQEWIAPKWLKIGLQQIEQDKLHMNSSALNLAVQVATTYDHGGLQAHAVVKDGYPGPFLSITGLFTAIGSSSVKTVADKHRHAAYHNKHLWRVQWHWTTLNLQLIGVLVTFAIFGCSAPFNQWIATKWIKHGRRQRRKG